MGTGRDWFSYCQTSWTPQPSIRSKAAKSQIAGECADEEVCIKVHDNGVGIPKDRIESIFDLYTGLNGSAKTAARGLGLGLTLVRNLAEQFAFVLVLFLIRAPVTHPAGLPPTCRRS